MTAISAENISKKYLEYLGLDPTLYSLCNRFRGCGEKHSDSTLGKTFEIRPDALLEFCEKFPDSDLTKEVVKASRESMEAIVPPFTVPDRLVEAFTKSFLDWKLGGYTREFWKEQGVWKQGVWKIRETR